MKKFKVSFVLYTEDMDSTDNDVTTDTVAEWVVRKTSDAGFCKKAVDIVAAEDGVDLSERTAAFSAAERTIMRQVVKVSDPLPYPLKPLKLANGGIDQMYDIPGNDKERVVLQCCAMDILRSKKACVDIHSGKSVLPKDANVIRWMDRNIVVCPDFANTGGMECDIAPADFDKVGFFESEIRR